jgi:hypothetical protein
MTTVKGFKFAHTLLSKMAKIKVLMSDKKLESSRSNVQLNSNRMLTGHSRNGIQHYFEMKHTSSNQTMIFS